LASGYCGERALQSAILEARDTRARSEFDPLMHQAGGVRDHSGEHCWLLRQNRIDLVLRTLRRTADPLLFRDRPGIVA
jgi:hypothetical protein